MPEGRPRRAKIKWRPWLRALHRDIGYVAVGLTLIYALSGLAVNHIADWDPNFVDIEREFQVEGPLPSDDREAAQAVLAQADIKEAPTDVYNLDGQLEITLPRSTLFVELESGKVHQTGQKERVPLRVMNWLHLNRGKKAWTRFADGYAVALLFLAVSGMFMIPGKKGIARRGAILVGLGVAVPIAYLAYFGGPASGS